MNEFLRTGEIITDEDILLLSEAARLWEEGRDDEEKGKIETWQPTAETERK